MPQKQLPTEDPEKHARAESINSRTGYTPEKRVSIFCNVWHEAFFILIVTGAQLITQANLGNTIFPISTIAAGLGVADQIFVQTWFVASYSCTVGAFVLITGRLGDIYGHKNLFLLGWIWLAIFSLAAGFAKNHILFDVLRALSGIGPSIMMPNAAALLAKAWPTDKRGQLWKMSAFCVFGAIAPGGYVLGAGWAELIVLSGAQWGWIYWSMAIVCFLLALVGFFAIPNTPALNGRGEGAVDYIGSAVGVSGLILIFISLNGAPGFTWHAATSPVLLVIGILALVAFTFIELRVIDPILPMTIFRSPTFVAVSISLCAGWSSFGIYQYYLPHFLLSFRGVPPLMVVLQMVPNVVIGAVAAVMAVYLLPRVPGYIIFGGAMLAFFAGQALMAFMPVKQSYWPMTFPLNIIICFGPDLSFACASLIASDNLKPEQQGVAGSFINTIVNYSIALGLAIAGNVEVSVAEKTGDALKGYRAAFYLGMGLGVLAIVCTAVFWRGMAGRHRGG